MVKYIHELQCPHVEALPDAIIVIDVEYPLNKIFLE